MKKHRLLVVSAFTLTLLSGGFILGALVAGARAGDRPNFHLIETNDLGAGLPYAGVLHDDRRNVTCWALNRADGVAISCLPDRATP